MRELHNSPTVLSESQVLVKMLKLCSRHEFRNPSLRRQDDTSVLVTWETLFSTIGKKESHVVSVLPNPHLPFEQFHREWMHEMIVNIENVTFFGTLIPLTSAEASRKALLTKLSTEGLQAYKQGLTTGEDKNFLKIFKPYMSQLGIHLPTKPATLVDLAKTLLGLSDELPGLSSLAV